MDSHLVRRDCTDNCGEWEVVEGCEWAGMVRVFAKCRGL